jgi:exosortase
VSESTHENSFKNLLSSQIAAVAMLVGFAAYMVWDQLHWWGDREDYSFGYLVPLFVGYVVYDRWPTIRSYLFRGAKPANEPKPHERSAVETSLEVLSVLGFAVCLVLFGLGALIRAANGPQDAASLAIAVGFSGLLLSTVFIFAKETVDGKPLALQARLGLTVLFLFPACIWLISAPLLSIVETKINVFLLNKVTIVVFGMLDFLGFELEREGNVLILPEGSVGVEEACSGIRSLTACLFAGSFLAAVFLDRFWKKVLLVFAAMCFAVLTNLLRSMFLTLWSYYHGGGAIDESWVLPIIGDIGTVHDVTGMAILVLTCIGLLCLLPIFNFKVPEFEDEEEFGEDAGGNSSRPEA